MSGFPERIPSPDPLDPMEGTCHHGKREECDECDAEREPDDEPFVDDSTSECEYCGRIFQGRGTDCGREHEPDEREPRGDGADYGAPSAAERLARDSFDADRGEPGRQS